MAASGGGKLGICCNLALTELLLETETKILHAVRSAITAIAELLVLSVLKLL